MPHRARLALLVVLALAPAAAPAAAFAASGDGASLDRIVRESFAWACEGGDCAYADGTLRLCAAAPNGVRLTRLVPTDDGFVTLVWDAEGEPGAPRRLAFALRAGEAREHRVVLDADLGLVTFEGGLIGAPAPHAFPARRVALNVTHDGGLVTVSVDGLPAAVAAYAPAERATRVAIEASGGACQVIDEFVTLTDVDKFSWRCEGECRVDRGLYLCGHASVIRWGQGADGAVRFGFDAGPASKPLSLEFRHGLGDDAHRVVLDPAQGEVRFALGLVGAPAPLGPAVGERAVEATHEGGAVRVRVDGALRAVASYSGGPALAFRLATEGGEGCAVVRDVELPFADSP